MPKRDYVLFVSDIRDCAKRILEYVKGKSFEEFTSNQMLIDAVIRNLEIPGQQPIVQFLELEQQTQTETST